MPAPASSGRAYCVLAMLFLFQTLNFFDKLVLGLSAVPMMRDLHIGPKQFGLIGAAFYLLFSISGTLVGLFVVGRVATKWILLGLATIWSISQISVLFAHTLGAVVAARVLLGLGEGPALPSALHACYDWFPAHRRSVPSAIVLQGISVGFLVGGPFLTAIIVRAGWRYGFLACALLGAAWAIGWSLLGRAGPYAAPPVAPAAPHPARALWLDGTVVGIMLMSTASYYVVGMTATWLPPYLQLGLHYTPIATGWIITAVFAFQSPLLLICGWLCHTLSRRGTSLRASLGHPSTLTLLLAGAALIAATHTGGAAQLVLVGVGFALPSLTTIFGAVMLANIAPPAQRGKLVVVIYSANSCAALLSTYGTGWIVGAAHAGKAAGFATAITLAGTVLIVGAAASFCTLFPDRTTARFALPPG